MRSLIAPRSLRLPAWLCSCKCKALLSYLASHLSQASCSPTQPHGIPIFYSSLLCQNAITIGKIIYDRPRMQCTMHTS